MSDTASVRHDDVVPTVVSKPVKRSKRRNRCIVPVALVASCMLALNAAVSLLIVQFNAPQVVAFDMKGTLDAFMDQSAKRALSPEAAGALSSRFTRAVDASLRAWQADNHALILVAPAVVSGAPDITADVQQMIAERMRGGGDE